MPDLSDIATFIEVVESRSLSRAAMRLGLSKSMVSRRLARLEDELGVPLLARSTRGLSLTEAGSDFQPHAERLLAEMQAARDALSRTGEATGRLRISAPNSLGTTHLGRVLAELALRHLRLEISTSYSDRFVDLVGEGFDAAIRLGVLRDSSLIARRIAPVHSVLVASPDYLARGGTPKSPEDLARHETIPHGEETWRFRRKGQTVTIRPRGRFRADSGTAEFAAVVAGLGVALMPGFLAGPSLASGGLVRLLPEWEVPIDGLYVVRPPPADPTPNKIRALTDIIVENFGDENWDGCPDPGP